MQLVLCFKGSAAWRRQRRLLLLLLLLLAVHTSADDGRV
jgi:hypothetical protein